MASPPQHDAAKRPRVPDGAGPGNNRPVTQREVRGKSVHQQTFSFGSGRQKWGMTLKHEHEKGEDGAAFNYDSKAKKFGAVTAHVELPKGMVRSPQALAHHSICMKRAHPDDHPCCVLSTE